MKKGTIAFFIPHRGCPHRCSFCDQRAISGEIEPVNPERIARELERAFSIPQSHQSEIAFFGGSFTCLPREEMERYLRAAFPYVERGLSAGIRCSTRPDGVTEEILDLFQWYGGKAVELGAQSMDDRVLLQNGRGHRAVDTKRAAALIHRAGLSLGLQMMVGLPGEGPEGARETAERLLSLKPDTVRIYPAVVVEGTQLADWYRSGVYTPLTLEQAVERCAPLLPLFEEQGVRVIRMGLHAEASLERNLLAGPYHPAFRELCESFLIRQEVDRALAAFSPGAALQLRIAPRDRSRTAGQKRQNLLHWRQMGYSIRLLEDPSLSEGQRQLLPDNETDQKGRRPCF
ncbi:MAG: radical SAM protein [Oscillospiraceae bacterium]|nr:radical SAM protein [Oscillospiraceae bacterium]